MKDILFKLIKPHSYTLLSFQPLIKFKMHNLIYLNNLVTVNFSFETSTTHTSVLMEIEIASQVISQFTRFRKAV